MQNVSLSMLYSELKALHKDVEVVKNALIPTEKLSTKELNEIRMIKKEMESGKEKSFNAIFGK